MDHTSNDGESQEIGEPGWRAVIDAMSVPALAIDHQGMVVHANQSLITLYPRTRIGQHIAQLNRSPELSQSIQQALSGETPVAIQIFERVPLERRLSAIITKIRRRTSSRQGVSILVTFVDETEQEMLAQMRADFIANASHELRTPLASLKGSIETLLGAARDDLVARERFLNLMATQATRMSRLIDDLLVLSRAEMHAHVVPTDIVDLSELIGFTVQSLEPVAAARNMKITVERPTQTLTVTADREELLQVFQNLVQNAIKYGKESGSIVIAMKPSAPSAVHGPRCAVSVTDDGPGIADHHIPRLTERFYRVSPTASRQAGGTGLGLAIVKHILTRHRGELLVTSTLGKGSTFTVLLNRHAELAPTNRIS